MQDVFDATGWLLGGQGKNHTWCLLQRANTGHRRHHSALRHFVCLSGELYARANAGTAFGFWWGILTHLVLIFLTWLGRGSLALSPVEKASMIYTNSGNLLIPLVAASMGQEWAVYICAYMGILQICVWTDGKSLICGEPQVDFNRAFGNLNIISMVIGFSLFCARIQFPGIFGQAVKSLGDVLGPASMLSIGISVSAIEHVGREKISRLLTVTATRLVAYPLIVMAIFLALRLNTLLPDAPQILLITLLGAGAPTGVVVSQIAQLYDKDAQYAITYGTLCSNCKDCFGIFVLII